MPGDIVVFTSDGVIEAHNEDRQLFGFDRLEQAVREGPGTSAGDMLTHIYHTMQQFVGDTVPHDDVAIVVVRV